MSAKLCPREPDGYIYEYDTYFGLARKVDNGGAEYNGQKPDRKRPYWLDAAPPQADADALLREWLACGISRDAGKYVEMQVPALLIDDTRAYLAAKDAP